MAWCRQATSHYLSQCWPRSMSPYGVIGPQWVHNCRSRYKAWHIPLPSNPWQVKLPVGQVDLGKVFFRNHISMTWCKTAVSPLLMHWTYCRLVLSHRYDLYWKMLNFGSQTSEFFYIWVRSRNCGCLVTWFCYQLIAKPGNKTAAVSWPDPYIEPCILNSHTYQHVTSRYITLLPFLILSDPPRFILRVARDEC